MGCKTMLKRGLIPTTAISGSFRISSALLYHPLKQQGHPPVEVIDVAILHVGQLAVGRDMIVALFNLLKLLHQEP